MTNIDHPPRRDGGHAHSGRKAPVIGLRPLALHAPDEVAIIGPDGDQWSRARFVDAVDRFASALQCCGIRTGDVLAALAPNCVEFLVAYFGALQAGAYFVPINPHLAEEEIDFILHDAAASVVVVHAAVGVRRIEVVARAAPALRVAIGRVPGFTSFAAFISARGRSSRSPASASPASASSASASPAFASPAAASPAAASPRPQSQAPALQPPIGRLMAYTSATTGRPKAVRRALRDRSADWPRIAAANRELLGLEPEDGQVHLCASMLYHAAPLIGCEVALQLGHRVVLMNGWSAESLLAAIERHRVTTSFMVPAMFVRMLKLPAALRENASTGSLRCVVHGAAPCPIGIKRQMLEWWGPVLWEAYGATEAQGTLVSPHEWLARPGTVGRAMPGGGVRILDEHGRELGPGQTGLVYLRVPGEERFEYVGDPRKTAACRRGEFVTVGDIGWLDADGYLFLADRRTEVILSSGVNVYPAEIEAALIEHPDVEDCAVIGEPHALFGQAPKAFVVLADGVRAGQGIKLDLLRHLGSRLAAMKWPRRIQFVTSLPRDPCGKLAKRRLAAISSAVQGCDGDASTVAVAPLSQKRP